MSQRCEVCERLYRLVDGWETVYCPACQRLPKEKVDPIQEERDRLKRIAAKFSVKSSQNEGSGSK